MGGIIMGKNEHKENYNNYITKVNKLMLIVFLSIMFVTVAGSVLQVYRGDRRIGFAIYNILVAGIAYVIAIFLYMKNSSNNIMRWVLATGFLLVDTYILLTSSCASKFSFILGFKINNYCWWNKFNIYTNICIYAGKVRK